jgi:hypothetical protein
LKRRLILLQPEKEKPREKLLCFESAFDITEFLAERMGVSVWAR